MYPNTAVADEEARLIRELDEKEKEAEEKRKQTEATQQRVVQQWNIVVNKLDRALKYWRMAAREEQLASAAEREECAMEYEREANAVLQRGVAEMRAMRWGSGYFDEPDLAEQKRLQEERVREEWERAEQRRAARTWRWQDVSNSVFSFLGEKFAK